MSEEGKALGGGEAVVRWEESAYGLNYVREAMQPERMMQVSSEASLSLE